jgi:hypothetical protein
MIENNSELEDLAVRLLGNTNERLRVVGAKILSIKDGTILEDYANELAAQDDSVNYLAVDIRKALNSTLPEVIINTEPPHATA